MADRIYSTLTSGDLKAIRDLYDEFYLPPYFSGECEGCDTSWVPSLSGRTCADEMKGDPCHCCIPDPRTEAWRTVDDLEAMDIYSHADTVEIEGANSDETELLLTAWEILHQNLDLIEWAMCMVLGFDSADIEKLLHKIQRSRLTVRIKVSGDCTFNEGEEAPYHAASGLAGGTIYLCSRSNWAWRNDYVKIWTSASNSLDKWCGALDLSATLLHELYHTIGIFGRAYNDHAGQCASTYLIENAFRFVLFRRYPTITNSACCLGRLNGEWLVGNSRGIWTHSGDCISTTGATGGFDYEEWIETKSTMEEWPKS